ncbi:putative leader peptide [Dactylosporangium sp. NPDC000555]
MYRKRERRAVARRVEGRVMTRLIARRHIDLQRVAASLCRTPPAVRRTG